MDRAHEDGFEVYVRSDPAHAFPPEESEQPVVHCASYEEARRVWAHWHASSKECVIRYLGDSGGGD